jgi:hypothetical protein
LKLVHEQIAAFHSQYSLKNLLAELPQLYFSASDSLNANARSRVLKTAERTVHTLTFGSFIACEQVLEPISGYLPLHSEALRRLVPPRCRFGYDLIVFCGLELYLHGRQVEEIKISIKQKSEVKISASEVQVLGYKFLKYLGRLHRHSIPAIRHQMARVGGYILHLDATCEEKNPLLLSCIDGLSGQVLYSKKIRSENKIDIKKILETVKDLFGLPLAVVTDMGRAFVSVIALVFPGIVHGICHYHFLRDLGNDFLSDDYDQLRRALRKTQIKAALRTLARRVEQKLGGAEKITAVFKQPNCQTYFTQAKEQELLQWYTLQLIYEIQFPERNGDGYGFPFDRPHLGYYQRLEITATNAKNLLQDVAHLPRRDKKDLLKLETILKTVTDDCHILKTVKSLRERVEIFDRFRQIMRLTRKGEAQGLNDNGSLSGHKKLQMIEKELDAYTSALEKKADRVGFQKQHPQLVTGIRDMIKQIRSYWDKLFMLPIIIQVGERQQEIIAQRTNNIMERSFRKIKRRCRRRHGRKRLQKDLAHLPAEIALVENLQNEQYVTTVMGSLDKLPEKFAELDRDKTMTLNEMKRSDSPIFSKKILRQLRKNDVKNLIENCLQNGIV